MRQSPWHIEIEVAVSRVESTLCGKTVILLDFHIAIVFWFCTLYLALFLFGISYGKLIAKPRLLRSQYEIIKYENPLEPLFNVFSPYEVEITKFAWIRHLFALAPLTKIVLKKHWER